MAHEAVEFFSFRQLPDVFEESNVIDVLAGTPLEGDGRENGYSIFLVRKAFAAQQSFWRECIDNMFKKGMEAGGRSIQVRGKKNKLPHYCSIQAVYKPCNCKYGYAGTARHPVVLLPNGDDTFGMVDDVLRWLEIKCGFLFEGHPCNEVVINSYDLAGVERIGGAFHGTRMTMCCCLRRP